MMRAGLWVIAALALTACATASPEQSWKPRADADLKADTAACRKDAEAVDFHTPQASHYGAVVAMASRTNEVDLTGDSLKRMYEGVMYQCMTEKGWTPAT